MFSSATKYWPLALVAGALALMSAHRGGSLDKVPMPQVSISMPHRPAEHVVPVDPPKAVEAPAPVVVPPPVAAPVAAPVPAPVAKPHKRKPVQAAAPAPAQSKKNCQFGDFIAGKCEAIVDGVSGL